jgi:[glutamine synthetase] adenylyltransferase / [glutamine synthetase]-adenylyl-L-tyrosine phosphorylase
MPDRTQLETELRRLYPEPWVRHHLDSFSPAYFAAFTPIEVAQHIELTRGLDDERLVITLAWPADAECSADSGGGESRWWLEVVGYDAFEFLSTLCNLLAVYGLSIVEGRVFTSQPPPRDASSPPVRRPSFRPGQGALPPRSNEREPDRRPKIVDRFLVRRTSASAAGPAWTALQTELQTLARLLREGQHDEVHHRLIGRVAVALRRQRGEEPGMEPLDLTIDPAADSTATVVHLAAADRFGFLSLTVSALSLCGIMIGQADIRTNDGRVSDTLWVTDRSGHKITGEARLRELRLSLILIEHFSRRLHRATNPEAALVHFSRFASATMERPDWAHEFAALDQPEVLDALVRVLGESDFLWEDYLHARPEDLLPMVGNPAEWRRPSRGELMADLQQAVAEADDDEARAAAFRRFKDREVFRAGFRAILAPEFVPETLAEELSDAAEVLLTAAFAVSGDLRRDVLPRRALGRPAPAALFALGKFGGRELGFASDLELILVFDDREIVDVPGAVSAGAAFDGLVAALRRLLAGRKGSTFELDFRLRPYGRAGAPATSLSAFADYYRGEGPAWSYERQAMIKLRAIAGDPELIAEVEALRDQFTYGPEPFDLEGYRRMRRLQFEQRVQPGRINAKLSPGALVDVEYFVQAMQIAHGGREPSVRTPNTQRAIAALEAAGFLGPSEAETMQACYRFFRSLVDALRVVHGHSQDLTVPLPGSEEFVLLARRMRQPDASALGAELQLRLGMIRALSARLEEFVGPLPE